MSILAATKMSRRDNFNGHGRAWATSGAYVYMHRLLHRLVWGVGNQITCLLWQLGE